MYSVSALILSPIHIFVALFPPKILKPDTRHLTPETNFLFLRLGIPDLVQGLMEKGRQTQNPFVGEVVWIRSLNKVIK